MSEPASERERRAWLGLLCVDAVVLALLELLFLPLRLDGRVLPDLGAAPFPYPSLLAALITTPLLVRWGLRAGRTAAVAGAPLYAWLLTLAVVGLFDRGGNHVLIPDWRTLLLLACGALPSAVVLGGALGSGGVAAAGPRQHLPGTLPGSGRR